MLAAGWFLMSGHQVYWPQVQQGATDFVVDLNGDLLRVQVKTATWVQSGTFSYLQCRTRLASGGAPGDGLYDLLVVIHEKDIWVIPAGLINSSNLCLRGTREGRPEGPWDRYQGQLP